MESSFCPHHPLKKAILITVLLSCLLPLGSIPIHAETVDGGTVLSSHTLPESADAGDDYLNRLIFFGESTTAHLSRNGGIWDTDAHRRQVWRDHSGTRMLDRRLMTSVIDYHLPNGSVTSVPLQDALLLERPAYLVLSFGLNGIVGFAKEPDRFLATYRCLLEQIQERSPQTKIILQSVYPVGNAETFSVDLDELNADIRFLNRQIQSLADTTAGVRFADTASVLSDDHGVLSAQYDIGDGIHLNNNAYCAILHYLCTHAWVS